MSDILIKRMEMPTNCGECLFAILSPTGESLICNYMLSRVSWEERPFDCPLVPVPKHGRLIDADDLIRRCNQHINECENSFAPQAQYYCERDKDFIRSLEIAPTIIEAEEET